MQIPSSLSVDSGRLEAFCRKWKVVEFALFGSVLRDDFSPESDIDVLVSFAPDARRSLFDLTDMEEELADLFNRPIDLVVRTSIERSKNPYRRDEILSSARTIYAAR